MDKSIFDPPGWIADLEKQEQIAQKFQNGDYIKTPDITIEDTPVTKIIKELETMGEDMREQRAREEADKKRESALQHRYTFLGAVYGSIATHLIEHFQEYSSFVIDTVGKLIDWFSSLL